MADESGQQIDTEKQTLAEGVTLVELWLRKIKAQEDEEKGWRTEARKAIEIYESDEKANIHFNILNSNVETLVPAVYNSTPVPDIRRRFGDADPIAKQVVDVSERLVSYSIDQYDLDTEIISAVKAALVPGRGAVRVRYSPTQTNSGLYQEVTAEAVSWDKFVRGPAKSWAKMPWVAFEHSLTRDELVQLNPEIGKKIDLTDGDKECPDKEFNERGIKRTAKTYEIWDKQSGEVLFICEHHKAAPLLKIKDPLGVPGFFPVMKPIQVMNRVSSLVPICPYTVYKPLIDELDIVTKRISKLVKQLKVRGIIAAELDSDFQQVKDLEDGQFVSAGDAATAFQAGAGGLDKSVWVWPMEPTVAALQQLYIQRDQIKQTIYEVTGIADIMRGATDANETLGAQQIKAQWGSLRVQQIQAEVARLARDLFRAKIAIMASKFSDENISLMTGLPQQDGAPAQSGAPTQQPSEQAQAWPQVLQLFRSDQRSFRIDIETDSTIRADMTRNQEQMNQFLAGTGQYAQAMAGAAQQFGPGIMPVMAEVYTAFARKFKLGKQAEDALDKLSTMAQQIAQQPQDQPNPEVEKAKMEMQAMQQKAQLEAQTAQQKAAIEIQQMQAQMQHDQEMFELKKQEMVMKLQAQERQLQLKAQGAQLEAQVKQQTAALDAQAADAQFSRDQRQADMDAQNAERAGEIKLKGMQDQQRFKQQAQKQKPKAEARANG